MIHQRATREVYRNRWLSVREDDVAFPGGVTGIYGVVDKPDFGLVIPAERDGFWLVEQYRYPLGRRSWEFPQGSWGEGAAGSAADLARSELAEETGLRAAELAHLGRLHEASGYSSAGFDVHLATGLTQGPTAREATEQDMQVAYVAEPDLITMVRRGEIVDGPTVAAYALLLVHRTTTAAGGAPG